MIRKYVIDIEGGEGAYRAVMPRLGLTAEASSPEKAARAVRRLARELVREAQACGKQIPPPEDLAALIDQRRPRIEIWWSEEDGVFLAEAPELPGCLTDGPTYEKALKNLIEVMGLWLYPGDDATTPSVLAGAESEFRRLEALEERVLREVTNFDGGNRLGRDEIHERAVR